jgi:hypothetical protein
MMGADDGSKVQDMLHVELWDYRIILDDNLFSSGVEIVDIKVLHIKGVNR